MITTLLTATSFVTILFFLSKLLYRSLGKVGGKRFPYPPGPPPKFLIGNALDFPKIEPGPTFARWGKLYQSDILHAQALGKHFVIINSRAIVEDLLEKRARLYTDRPWLPSIEIQGWIWNVSIQRQGEGWRQHRRMCQQHFNAVAARRYEPIQLERVHYFLREVMREPEKVFSHNKMLSLSIPLQMMYGYNLATLDDPLIHTGEEMIALQAPLGSAGALINLLPILRHIPYWVPGAYTQKIAKRVEKLGQKMMRIPLDHVRREFREGRAMPSFMNSFLEKEAIEGGSPEEFKMVNSVAMTTYAAASDTTIASTGAFLHAMIIHPDVQRKAQAELDNLIGHDRLPEFRDRASLPYIEAIYREVMRWHPVVPPGLPHALSEDDVYDGYLLPKGAAVIGNIWAMTHDERVYPDPDKFKPERFFDAQGNLNGDNRILAYGFGRRVCAGKHIASATMWLTIASFLACFDIKPAKDEFGKEVEIDHEYDDYFILSHKKPFKCSITARTEHIRSLVLEK